MNEIEKLQEQNMRILKDKLLKSDLRAGLTYIAKEEREKAMSKLLKRIEKMKIRYLAHAYMVSPDVMRKTRTMQPTEIKEYFRKVKPHGGRGWKWFALHFLVTECYETGWNDAIDSIIKGIRKEKP